MSAWFGPYLGLALMVALAGACGSESPTKKDPDSASADDDSDDDSTADDDDSTADDDSDDDDDSKAPANTMKDGGVVKNDSGAKDSGAAKDSGGGSITPGKDGGSTAPAKDSGPAGTTGDAGRPARDSGPAAPPLTGGKCCDDGNCICRDAPPNELSARNGPFRFRDYGIGAGQVYYPEGAEAPYSAVAIIPGFLNTGPEMTTWCTFYASWGIVCVVTSSGALDIPGLRAAWLAGAIDELKQENNKQGSPLQGKLAGRYGTSGYSMGGGGTTIAASEDPSLKTSIGLAPWGGTGRGTKVPTMVMCGSIDAVAPCSMATGVYTEIPEDTPKMGLEFPSSDHLVSWFGPGDSGSGMSGGKALAFQKVFLEGDTRWKQLLLGPSGSATQVTNIK